MAGITLNYRKAGLTIACAKSMLKQGLSPVLVWDNSEDEGKSAAEIAQSFRDDSRVRVLRSPVNLGFAIGVNRSLAWLREHYSPRQTLLLNNDALLFPLAASKLSAALDQLPNALFVYPRIDHGGRVVGTVYYHPLLALLRPRAFTGAFAYASGCCMLVAAHAPPRLFDEDFFMYGEDIFLGWQLKIHPLHEWLVPEVLVSHAGSSGSGMATFFYESRIVAAHCLLMLKLANGPLKLAGYALARAGLLFIRALLRAGRYRSLVPLQALLPGWHLARGDDPILTRARSAEEAVEVSQTISPSAMPTLSDTAFSGMAATQAKGS